MSTKPCPDCGEVKPLSEFGNDKRNKDGKRVYCKPCNNAHAAAWREANPDKEAESQRRTNLKRYYGITPEQYDEMLEEQGGRCACCGTDNPGGKGRFHVDHCHDSNEVRGLLCNDCNVGIGRLGDNVDGIWNAMLYLVKYEHKELTS